MPVIFSMFLKTQLFLQDFWLLFVFSEISSTASEPVPRGQASEAVRHRDLQGDLQITMTQNFCGAWISLDG